MRHLILAIILTASASAADVMHVPFLVEHDKEAHAVAGALVTWGVAEALPDAWPAWVRYSLGATAAWGVGWGKELYVDHKPDAADANAWAVGAGAVVGFRLCF